MNFFNKTYGALGFENIKEFFNSLAEDNFENISALREIKEKLYDFHRNSNEVLKYTDIERATYISNGNLTLSGDTIIFDTLIVSGDLTIFGNNLIIKKLLVVGGNANLYLNENISNTEKIKIWCINPKTVIFIGGELKRLAKEKESNIKFFGNTVLTILDDIYIQGTLNISGNCYFHSNVKIGKDLITHTLTLMNCRRLSVNGHILLKNNLKIKGNTNINLPINNFCKFNNREKLIFNQPKAYEESN